MHSLLDNSQTCRHADMQRLLCCVRGSCPSRHPRRDQEESAGHSMSRVVERGDAAPWECCCLAADWEEQHSKMVYCSVNDVLFNEIHRRWWGGVEALLSSLSPPPPPPTTARLACSSLPTQTNTRHTPLFFHSTSASMGGIVTASMRRGPLPGRSRRLGVTTTPAGSRGVVAWDRDGRRGAPGGERDTLPVRG